MSDEEEDYMSDAFLKGLDDKRPGLVYSSTTARKHELEKKKREKDEQSKFKPKKVLEMEKREEGLKSVIGSDNKGFALLAKMGYKPGMSIGKKGEGRSEPVPIELKSGRGGLGREQEVKRKTEQYKHASMAAQQKRIKLMNENKQKFVDRMSNKFNEQRGSSDLYKSQKVCADLDSRINLLEPERSFYWPESYKTYDEDDEEYEYDEDINLTPSEKLEILTDYLRTKHLYCVWCGTSYNDSDDLVQNCPGNTAEDHDD